MTANQDLFDAALRHQVALRRYGDTTLRRIKRLLEEADRDLAEKLRQRLGRVLSEADPTGERLRALLEEVRAMREAVMAQLRASARGELIDLAKLEAEWEQSIMSSAIPLEMAVASAPLARLNAVVTSRPFQGRFLREWFQSIQRAEQEGLKQALRLGITNGETLDDIVRRVVGTRANRYTDGVLAITRRNAEAVMRTAITHVSNAARGEVWEANADIIYALRWTATLDGRTSAVCRARDGDLVMMNGNALPQGASALSPPEARPPAHINCRSVMVAVFSPEGILGDRPFVRDKRGRAERERDFRAAAREEAGEAWSGMSEAQRRAAIARQRDAWGEANIGQVPSTTTYQEWMRRQPVEFQDEVLGQTKARLFRRGDLTLDDFVDRAGRELTLDELRRRFPRAFETGGVS